MTKEELQEQAYDKVWPIYSRLARESLQDDLYWTIDKDRAKELMASHNKEVEIYSYILSLIEKDNYEKHTRITNITK